MHLRAKMARSRSGPLVLLLLSLSVVHVGGWQPLQLGRQTRLPCASAPRGACSALHERQPPALMSAEAVETTDPVVGENPDAETPIVEMPPPRRVAALVTAVLLWCSPILALIGTALV